MKVECSICNTIIHDDTKEFCGVYLELTGKCWRCDSKSFKVIN